MKLFYCTWLDQSPFGNKILEECGQFVLAPSARQAKETVLHIDDCYPIRDRVLAEEITCEADILKHVSEEHYPKCFVEDARDYLSGIGDRNRMEPYGRDLGSNDPNERTLIQELREQWRQEENDRQARELQIEMALI